MGGYPILTDPVNLLSTGSATHDILAILWFLLIGVLILGYFILDGFDLGAGVLSPFIAKKKEERQFIRRAIGPLWDGNEVWLLTAGGALFAAFAPAYASGFSGFYLAIMLVLFGLIFRAIAVEYADRDAKHEKMWNILFAIGSFLPALLFGAAIGNVIQGVAVGDAAYATSQGGNLQAIATLGLPIGTDYIGKFFQLLNPFALLCAVLGLVAFITQGAAWIALKAPIGSEIQQRAAKVRSTFNIISLVCFVLVSVWFFVAVYPTFSPDRSMMLFAYVFAGIFVIGWIIARIFINAKNDLMSFLGVNITPIALIGITAASIFPNIIPVAQNGVNYNADGTIASVDPYFIFPAMDGAPLNHIGIAPEDGTATMTLFAAANSEVCLTAMLVITCIGLPLVLAYHVIIYRTFRGRIQMNDLEY